MNSIDADMATIWQFPFISKVTGVKCRHRHTHTHTPHPRGLTLFGCRRDVKWRRLGCPVWFKRLVAQRMCVAAAPWKKRSFVINAESSEGAKFFIPLNVLKSFYLVVSSARLRTFFSKSQKKKERSSHKKPWSNSSAKILRQKHSIESTSTPAQLELRMTKNIIPTWVNNISSIHVTTSWWRESEEIWVRIVGRESV